MAQETAHGCPFPRVCPICKESLRCRVCARIDCICPQYQPTRVSIAEAMIEDVLRVTGCRYLELWIETVRGSDA